MSDSDNSTSRNIRWAGDDVPYTGPMGSEQDSRKRQPKGSACYAISSFHPEACLEESKHRRIAKHGSDFYIKSFDQSNRQSSSHTVCLCAPDHGVSPLHEYKLSRAHKKNTSIGTTVQAELRTFDRAVGSSSCAQCSLGRGPPSWLPLRKARFRRRQRGQHASAWLKWHSEQ